MARAGERPDYYKFPRDLYEAARDLPGVQGARLCMAALALFYDGKEPDGLSVRAECVMSGFRERISRARTSFEAATERTPNGRQTDSKRSPNGRQTVAKRPPNENQTDSKREGEEGDLAARTGIPCVQAPIQAPVEEVLIDKRYRDKRKGTNTPPPLDKGFQGSTGEGDWMAEHLGRTWRI